MRQRYPLVGLGQSLPDISSLPAVGDLSGQLTQGANLISTAQQTIASGDPNGIAKLLSAGMTFAKNATSTDPGVIVRDLVEIGAATATGAATGGPWGALAGAIVSSIEVLIDSLFGGG